MQTKTQFETVSNPAASNENLKCWNIGSNPLCLRIELSDGTQFMLPYGYFEGAKFVREADAEILNLQFKEKEFAIRGKGLNELFLALQLLSVESMKECPRRYEPLARAGGFIEEIKPIQSDASPEA